MFPSLLLIARSVADRGRRGSLLLLTGLIASCQPAAPATAPAPTPSAIAPQSSAPTGSAVDHYETLPAEQRQPPPSAGPAPAWSFPALSDRALPNGLQLKHLQRSALPLVQLKLVIRSGQATDGDQPGLAVLAGEMLKVGGSADLSGAELLNKVESLGSNLEVLTTRDATTLSIAVTSDRFAEALELLGKVTTQPRFNATEFDKLKRREMDRTSSQARTSGAWVANVVLYRELYRLTKGTHPYATFDSTSEQLERIQLANVKRWYKTHFSPRNSVLVVTGDVSAEVAQQAAQAALGSWRGGSVVRKPYATPNVAEGLQIFLVDRPKSSQAEVRLALFGPTGQSEHYPGLRVVNQVLGGGVAGRLFLDVREKRSLAYSTGSSVERIAEGPVPVILQAGTQTAKAGLALQALLEHARGIAQTPPNVTETKIAARYLSDLFLLKMESGDSVADMVAQLSILGLPNDYYERYRSAVASTQAPQAASIAGQVFLSGRLIAVVAGDAERLGVPLSHFGAVSIVDPEQGFKTIKQLPQDASATIELERVDGT